MRDCSLPCRVVYVYNLSIVCNFFFLFFLFNEQHRQNSKPGPASLAKEQFLQFTIVYSFSLSAFIAIINFASVHSQQQIFSTFQRFTLQLKTYKRRTLIFKLNWLPLQRAENNIQWSDPFSWTFGHLKYYLFTQTWERRRKVNRIQNEAKENIAWHEWKISNCC